MENNVRFKGIPLCKGAPELGNSCGKCARCRAPAKFQSGNQEFEAVCRNDVSIAQALLALEPGRAYDLKHHMWIGWLAHAGVYGAQLEQQAERIKWLQTNNEQLDKALANKVFAPPKEDEAIGIAWQAGYDTGYYAKNPAHERPAAQPQGETVAWAYCPECGCEEIHHQQGRHKQCADCHQEWFSDIDYSDVVRGHLKKLKAEQPAPVAVVLPERKQHVHQGLSHTDAKADGWNACLDEVTRLNAVKP